MQSNPPRCEYRKLSVIKKHVHLGRAPENDTFSKEVVFPYAELTEQDLFAILRPSLLAQLPKLREAIRSLKLANELGANHDLVTDGCIVKENQDKEPFLEACQQPIDALLNPRITIDIMKLSQQIANQCVYGTSYKSVEKWGNANDKDLENCAGLQSRLEETVNSESLDCLFKPAGKTSLVDVLEQFCEHADARILRISLQYLSSAYNCREVVSNAIGRHVLELARKGKFHLSLWTSSWKKIWKAFPMRLKDKVAIIVGAGQTPGDTVGNGRATAILFAREGARVALIDRNRESALETQALIEAEGGTCFAFSADVTRAQDCDAFVKATLETYGRVDILHNNVGIGTGDDGILRLSEESWDRIMQVNLKGMFLSCKGVLPVMREQRSGSIINISSIAAVCSANIVAYKASKAGLNALTHQIAMDNAKYNIRANVIMPGLMNTPMAIEGISKSRGIPKRELIRQRDARVPLGQKMGSAWDVAYAALFLASDEAKFITGVVLPVDGGQSARIG